MSLCSVGDLPTRVILNLVRDLFTARYCCSEELPPGVSCEYVMLGALVGAVSEGLELLGYIASELGVNVLLVVGCEGRCQEDL